MRGKRSRPSYATRSGRPKYRKRDSPCQEGGERHAESRPSSRAGTKNEKRIGFAAGHSFRLDFVAAAAERSNHLEQCQSCLTRRMLADRLSWREGTSITASEHRNSFAPRLRYFGLEIFRS